MVENFIILDSNFILLPYQFKIDYFREITEALVGKVIFIVFQQVLDELEAKKTNFPNKVRFQKDFASGINFLNISKHKYQILFEKDQKEKFETTDDFLIRKCKDLSTKQAEIFLATNDKELRKKARNNNISTFYMRQKKYIEVERV